MINTKSHAIIIGAMKAGTSALFEYLGHHPEICLSIHKEPEFFSINQEHKVALESYDSLWTFDPSIHKIALEASTGYTKYPMEVDVAKRMYETLVDPKLIYIVRNPFERIISHYHFVRNNPAWGTDELGSKSAINFSKYYMQLEQYRKYFPKNSILILDFDDLKHNPNELLRKTFSFLGVEEIDDPIKVHKVVHKTPVKSDFEILIKKKLGGLIEQLPLKIRLTAGESFRKIVGGKKAVMDNQLKMEIYGSLNEDMKQFSEEYGFDVAKWGF